MTHSAVLLALDALACLRLTRLVVADTITAAIRARLIGRTYEGQPRPGTTMAAAAIAEGRARDELDVEVLANELQRAGYITWQVARHDQ